MGAGGADGGGGPEDPRSNFDTTGTIGIEEEFYIVGADDRPTAGTDDLVYGDDPPAVLDGRLDHELFQCTIETQTPVIDDPTDVRAVLGRVRRALVDHAETNGYGIAAAGLHPAADWRDLEHATKPRYREQLDRIRYPQHRNLTSGVHVHVGVDDPDAAVWIANEVRWVLPLLLALSANSPYWCGIDTGLASARAVIFENLPNTGVPTRFESFDGYLRFERRLVDEDVVRDRGELWFDVRPHTGLGTVEFRVPDAQRDPDRVADFAAYVAELVRDLRERYADGASGSDPRREYLDANKWRALRYGREATFLDRGGGTIGLGEWVDRESERTGGDAIRTLRDAPGGAERQRRYRDSDGLDGLCAALRLGEPGGL
jgi:carboxylate-amine ligase